MTKRQLHELIMVLINN